MFVNGLTLGYWLLLTLVPIILNREEIGFITLMII